jgi:acetyl esterase/lipase
MHFLRCLGLIAFTGSLLVSNLAVAADSKWGTKARPTRTVVYKDSDFVELRLHVFEPKQTSGPTRPAAIVFFFGGGWTGGSPGQFYPHCEYFASRGMLAMSAEYRVASRNGTSPFSCVRDGKAAVRWIRAHADELNIDPNKIVAGGGSAGGHVAASTALIKGVDASCKASGVSARPDAMILFNPVIDTTKQGYGEGKLPGCALELSPVHHVRPGLPPTIVFHGTADTTVPFENVVRFEKRMKEAGNVCELVPFEGQKHGFFNRSRNPKAYAQTIKAVDAFLVAQSLLAPE